MPLRSIDSISFVLSLIVNDAGGPLGLEVNIAVCPCRVHVLIFSFQFNGHASTSAVLNLPSTCWQHSSELRALKEALDAGMQYRCACRHLVLISDRFVCFTFGKNT